ncbi:MAG: helix-turn-helix domain-containing protein [Bacteroides sp.]|nr:helix-turn-helix domain-containing protein [Bacteroides sp.]
MSINEIINTDSNVMLVISAADLKEFVLELLDERKGPSKLTPERFLTITDTVGKYGISKSTLWRWSKIGYLPKVKLGGKCFYLESDIIKLLEGGCHE